VLDVYLLVKGGLIINALERRAQRASTQVLDSLEDMEDTEDTSRDTEIKEEKVDDTGLFLIICYFYQMAGKIISAPQVTGICTRVCTVYNEPT
jgi:hypothetical protein